VQQTWQLTCGVLTVVCGILAVATAQPHQSAVQGRLTAQQVIDRIKERVGVPWLSQTVDTFKAGDPDTPVTGIAVTMMATYDVLQRAADSGSNLIITHEPTFYGHQDETDALEQAGDPIYRSKQALIAQHHLVIWRFHDHWHRRQPDGIMTGMVRALGWESFQRKADPAIFDLPETSLTELAGQIRERLHAMTLRVVGDPALKVAKVALSPGFGGFTMNRPLLARDDVQVLVIGEAHEWEAIEYAADASASGHGKGLIAIGHIPSEQAGMEECVRWLRTFVTEVPVEFVAAKDPFWE
jgi:putative NIF3 family GTP cyclohydrolase 1 type 2